MKTVIQTNNVRVLEISTIPCSYKLALTITNISTEKSQTQKRSKNIDLREISLFLPSHFCSKDKSCISDKIPLVNREVYHEEIPHNMGYNVD